MMKTVWRIWTILARDTSPIRCEARAELLSHLGSQPADADESKLVEGSSIGGICTDINCCSR
jgi:hypothetical protein